jgi:hyperosmotically inducible periplasmic protein
MNRTQVACTALSTAFLLMACERAGVGEKGVTTPSELAAQAERQIEKSGALIDDATITARIKTALIAEPGLKGFAIDVDTSQNIVSLRGTVASDAARKKAEDIARETQGVKAVRNELTVKPTAS